MFKSRLLCQLLTVFTVAVLAYTCWPIVLFVLQVLCQHALDVWTSFTFHPLVRCLAFMLWIDASQLRQREKDEGDGEREEGPIEREQKE